MNKKGFTLLEILTAVIIVAILTVMALPLYEKTIERSRMAEARSILNRLAASKWQVIESMEKSAYDTSIKMKHLNVAFAPSSSDYSFATKDFVYSINPGGVNKDGVCAKRSLGEHAGTVFYYIGQTAAYNGSTQFLCYGSQDDCEAYGMDSAGGNITCGD